MEIIRTLVSGSVFVYYLGTNGDFGDAFQLLPNAQKRRDVVDTPSAIVGVKWHGQCLMVRSKCWAADA